MLAHWTAETLALLGYGGIAILMFIEDIVLPIPSEVIMPIAGIMSERYGLSIWGLIVAGTLGSLVGGLPWYYLGRAIGDGHVPKWIRHRREILEGRPMREAQRWFTRHGHAAVLLARMLPGVRPLIGIPAGLSRMPLGTFLLYSAMGTFAWSAGLAFAGKVLGSEADRLTQVIGPVSGVILALVIGAIWWSTHRRRLRAGAAPPPDKPQSSATMP